MNVADKQMLMLIDILKTLDIIRYDTEFCDAVGLKKQNLVNIKAGRNYFTPEHIRMAIKEFKVNANWIFGVSDKIFIHHEFDPRLAKLDLKEKSHR